MDRYTFTSKEAEVLKEAFQVRQPHQITRNVFSQEEITDITDYAVKYGVAKAVRYFNTKSDKQVSQPTVSKYLKHWKENNGYMEPKIRGRKPLLHVEEAEMAITIFEKLRIQGTAIDARFFCSVVKGIIKLRPAGDLLLAQNYHIVSPSWARQFLKSKGCRVRKSTTDRIVSAEEVVNAGQEFFKSLSALAKEGLRPDLVFNCDEFFVSFDNSNQKWTWTRCTKDSSASVPIKTSKAGFTCSVLSSMDGKIHLLQIIHKAKTGRVHVELEDDSKIIQQHREDSHFQNEQTWRVWLDYFVKIVNRIRQDDQDQQAILIYDSATQHSVTSTYLEPKRIDCICVPPKMTHIFQPADQFVISNLKATARKIYNDQITEIVQQAGGVDEIVKQLTVTNVKVNRERKIQCLVQAMNLLSESSVLTSWHVTGIPRALRLDISSDKQVNYDLYVDLSTSTKEFIDKAVDEEEEEEPEQPATKKRGRPRKPTEVTTASPQKKQRTITSFFQ
jgi:D-lyxose ketol-isomerase